jgi:hypothetical protein
MKIINIAIKYIIYILFCLMGVGASVFAIKLFAHLLEKSAISGIAVAPFAIVILCMGLIFVISSIKCIIKEVK